MKSVKPIFTHTFVSLLASLLVFLYMDEQLYSERTKPKQVHYKSIYIDQWGQAYDFVKEK